MARDYANSGSKKRRRSSSAATRGRSEPMPGWVWLVVGLSIGLVVAAFAWISRPHPAAPAATAAGGSSTDTHSANQASQANQAIPLPPKQPSRFSFYQLLPSYEVVIPKADADAAIKAGKPTTADIAEPGQYLVQAGAYKTRDEAERNRAALALLGVEPRIEQITIDQNETWYRVRIGPANSLAEAQQIVDRLDTNGFKAILIKVKNS